MEESHGFFHSACLKLNESVRKNKVSLGISGENSGYPRQFRSVSRTMAFFFPESSCISQRPSCMEKIARYMVYLRNLTSGKA